MVPLRTGIGRRRNSRHHVANCECGFCRGRTALRHGDGIHGRRASEYRAWAAIKQRCLNERCKCYHHYGGRGIKICDRWLTYDNFLADMGRRPSSRNSIDRVDNDGNYEKNNCRWATRSEQAYNRRKIKRALSDRCRSGKHLYLPGSYYVTSRGTRECKQCRKDAKAKRELAAVEVTKFRSAWEENAR